MSKIYWNNLPAISHPFFSQEIHGPCSTVGYHPRQYLGLKFALHSRLTVVLLSIAFLDTSFLSDTLLSVPQDLKRRNKSMDRPTTTVCELIDFVGKR